MKDNLDIPQFTPIPAVKKAAAIPERTWKEVTLDG